MLKYQFTFYDKQKRYRPISTIITPFNSKETITEMCRRAIYNARTTRGWTEEEMIEKYGYNSYKFRPVSAENKPIL